MLCRNPSPTALNSPADFEKLAQEHLALSQSYLDAAAALRARNQAPPAAPSPPAAEYQPSAPAALFAGIKQGCNASGCLCPKCCGNGGQCKKYDAWQNYTAWMHWG